MTDTLEEVLKQLADQFAARVVERLRDTEGGWIDQGASPLGRRRHITLVRRGGPGVAILGRRFLATREAVAAEMGRLTRRGQARRHPSAAEELRAELRLVGGRK